MLFQPALCQPMPLRAVAMQSCAARIGLDCTGGGGAVCPRCVQRVTAACMAGGSSMHEVCLYVLATTCWSIHMQAHHLHTRIRTRVLSGRPSWWGVIVQVPGQGQELDGSLRATLTSCNMIIPVHVINPRTPTPASHGCSCCKQLCFGPREAHRRHTVDMPYGFPARPLVTDVWETNGMLSVPVLPSLEELCCAWVHR